MQSLHCVRVWMCFDAAMKCCHSDGSWGTWCLLCNGAMYTTLNVANFAALDIICGHVAISWWWFMCAQKHYDAIMWIGCTDQTELQSCLNTTDDLQTACILKPSSSSFCENYKENLTTCVESLSNRQKIKRKLRLFCGSLCQTRQ